MLFCESHISFGGFLQGSGGKDLLVELFTKAQCESDLKRLLVVETFIHRGCGGSRFACHRSEGEATRSAKTPKTLCHLHDAFLKILVRGWGHGRWFSNCKSIK